MEEMDFYVIVLEKAELYEKLIAAFNNAGISGSTTVSSVSMESSLATREDSHIIAALRAFMTADRVESKTVFGVCPKNKTMLIHDTLISVTGDINKPNSATFTAFPVSYADGFYRTAEVKK